MTIEEASAPRRRQGACVRASHRTEAAPVAHRRGATLFLAVALLLASAFGQTARAQDSHNVELLGHLDLHSQYKDIWGYHAPDGTEIAVVGTSEGTQFVDVTDPTNPIEVLFLEGPTSGWREIRTYLSYVYIVNDNRSNESLQIVDMTDPRAPVKVYGRSEFFNKAHTIFVDGSTLYACGTDTAQGYVALDLTDPVAPRFAGSFDEFYIHDIFVRDGIAYAAQVYQPGFLGILDVSDPASPSILSEVGYPDAMTHNAWLTDDSRFCVTSDEIEGGHVRIWNVEDPRNVQPVSEWTHPEEEFSSVHNVFVLGSRVYCSWYTAGLEVLDISNPAFPQRIASYDTYPSDRPVFEGAWGVYPYLPSGVILLSDISTGLYLLQVDPVLGTARLRVTDQTTGEPIAAEVAFPDEVLDPGLRASIDAGGELELFLTPGTQRAFLTAFGYAPAHVELAIARDQVTEVQVQLEPLPSGALSGVIRRKREGGAQGEPLEGVRVRVLDTPLETRSSEAGAFTFPAVPAGDWTVELRRFGFRTEPFPVGIEAGEAEDRAFELVSSHFADDFESERGWTVGDPQDDALSGIWVRDDPIGTGGGLTAPEDDASEMGVGAFVTGNRGGDIGNDDVDGGQTTLFSPSHDLSQVFRPWLVFRLWYESSDDLDPNSDLFTVDASTDGGIRWTNLMRTSQNTSGWAERRIPIGRSVQLGTDVRFRFVARDTGLGSIVEVGIDDVQIDPGRSDEPYYAEGPEGVSLLLAPPFPNPFHDEVRVQFSLREEDEIGLEVFDAIGRRIRRMDAVRSSQGPGHLTWDGRDDSGRRVPSGVYWLFVRTQREEETMRVVRLR